MIPLKDAYTELAGTIINASICWDVWWELQNAANANHDEYRKVVQRYSLFFEANSGAHLVAILVHLYQAYETRHDTQNFNTLATRLANEDASASGIVSKLRDDIQSIAPVWKKIARARSTVIAHLSNKDSSATLMQAADLTPDEIKSVIVSSKKTLNALADHFGILGTSMLNMNAVPDTKALMKALA